MSRVESSSAELQQRVSTARLARASAIAPLLLVVPLTAFVVFAMNSESFPKMTAGFGPAIFALGILPVYAGIAIGYFALAVILRMLGLLSLRSMLLASAALSVAIGCLYVFWSEETSANELLESFAVGTGYHAPIWGAMSWLWWRLTRGQTPRSSPPAADKSEA